MAIPFTAGESVDDLAAALLVHHFGMPAQLAAVELLRDSGYLGTVTPFAQWFTDDDFDEYVEDAPRAASLDWDAIGYALDDWKKPKIWRGDYPSLVALPSVEWHVLAVAVSMAGARAVDLEDAITGVDDTNASLIGTALQSAREHHHARERFLADRDALQQRSTGQ